MVVTLILVPVAWLLGTFPSALLVSRARGVDITTEGSGNPGASNVARLLGWRFGLIVLLMDFAKGAAAAGAGLAVGGRAGAYVLGVAAVLGHTFPLYRKGGKGVAAAAGMLVVLFPLIVLGLGVLWVLVARLLRKASFASLLNAVAFPVLVAVTGHDPWEIGIVGALALLVIARHAGNIRRLFRREEIGLDAPPTIS